MVKGIVQSKKREKQKSNSTAIKVGKTEGVWQT